MLKVSRETDRIIKQWCSDNLPKINALEKYNPPFEKLKEERANGVVNVFGGGSVNTIFNDLDTTIYYRAWHDTMHLKYNKDFSKSSELFMAVAQEEEAILMGICPRDAELIKLDLHLHISYYYQHKKHPEFQHKMIADWFDQGDSVIKNIYH